MIGTGSFYGHYFIKALNKEIGWATDTIKCMLCTSSYVPDKNNHIYKSDVTNEISGSTGYAAGGFTLSNKTISYDTNSSKAILDADDISVANVTINNARYAVLYADTGNPETSPLIGYFDFGTDRGVTNGSFALSWSASGIFSNSIG